MKQHDTTTTLSALATLLLATACGGGGGGGENQASVELTASPDAAVTPMGAAVEILVGNNDVGPAEEVEVTKLPENGTLSEESPVAITYTPEPGFVGLDTFEYRMKVESSLSESVTVQVLVTEQIVYVAGQGPSSSLHFVLTDGESSLANSEALSGLPEDAQGVPFAFEGDLDPAFIPGLDTHAITSYVVSPNGRWVAAVGVGSPLLGLPMDTLTVIDMVTHVSSQVFSSAPFSSISGVQFSASGDHLVFLDTSFVAMTRSAYQVSLKDGLPEPGAAALATPNFALGKVISFELSPNAEVCALRIENEFDDGDKLYALDLEVGSDSLLCMTPQDIFGGDSNRTCPEFAWVPSGEGAELHTLIYRTDFWVESGNFQLRGRTTSQIGHSWRIDTDGGNNQDAAVTSFSISPDGSRVAYRKDGGIQGKHALYEHTTSPVAFDTASRVLTPDAGSTTIEGYVWDASSSLIYAQVDQGGLMQGPSELHVHAVDLGPGPNLIVSDAPGVLEGLTALGEGESSGVLYRRSFVEIIPGAGQGQEIEMPLNSVELWNRNTGSTHTYATGLIEEVQLSRDGERIAIFLPDGGARELEVAAAMEEPFHFHANKLAGSGVQIISDSFTFTAGSSRWAYRDMDTGHLMLGGADQVERAIVLDRPTARELAAIPGLSD